MAPTHQRLCPWLALLRQRRPDPGRLIKVPCPPGAVGRRQLLLSGERDQTPDDQRNEGDEEPAGDSRLHDIFRDLVLHFVYVNEM